MADFSYDEFAPMPQPGRSADSAGLSSTISTIDEDLLTGLATRSRLIEQLEKVTSGHRSQKAAPALILLDLLRFKTVNDGLGPVICDRLLCRVSQRLQAVVPNALVARISGDGFAVLLEGGSDAVSVAEKLLDFMGRPYAVAGNAITLGANIGVAVAGVVGDSGTNLFHSADLALHQAQNNGRNCIRYYHPSMQELAIGRQSLESDFRASIALQHVELSRALKSEQFEVHYQPQVSLADGQLTGFEALVRWNHPERGLVMPDKFIPLAEETGLIDVLGEWVLRTACRDAAAWPAHGSGRPLRVAVNLSPSQLRDSGRMLDTIKSAVTEANLVVSRLELELTESALVGDISGTLAAIRDLGVDLALDDFGTGYSSLNRLHCLPFNRIKIDRSFVANLDCGEAGGVRQSNGWMVRAIASLGLGLGLDTVIEGIETPRQRDVARAAGCTEMQGYLVSAPVRDLDVVQTITRLAARSRKVHR